MPFVSCSCYVHVYKQWNRVFYTKLHMHLVSRCIDDFWNRRKTFTDKLATEWQVAGLVMLLTGDCQMLGS
jgi:putative heme degradation protein